MFDIDPDRVTPHQRSTAAVVMFAELYGSTAKGCIGCGAAASRCPECGRPVCQSCAERPSLLGFVTCCIIDENDPEFDPYDCSDPPVKCVTCGKPDCGAHGRSSDNRR